MKPKVEINSMAMSVGAHAILTYRDRSGKVHTREVTVKKKDEESRQKLELTAIIEALKILKPGCKITLNTMQTTIETSIRLGWAENWKKDGWKNAKKEQVKNKEEWQQVLELLQQHELVKE